LPTRFGRTRRYALGKLSGKASVDHNLKALGIELSDSDRDLILRRIIELGDKKHHISAEDLPFIITDVLKTPADQLLRITSWRVFVSNDEAPRAEVTLSYHGQIEKAEAQGDGGYDSLMNAVRKAVKTFDLEVPRLDDFRSRIPPGGRTGALVETVITWRKEVPGTKGSRKSVETFSTLGVDSDQLGAAVIATEKMLNAILPRPDEKRARGTKKAAVRSRKTADRKRSARK
jgi:D-citramalate synthase